MSALCSGLRHASVSFGSDLPRWASGLKRCSGSHPVFPDPALTPFSDLLEPISKSKSARSAYKIGAC